MVVQPWKNELVCVQQCNVSESFIIDEDRRVCTGCDMDNVIFYEFSEDNRSRYCLLSCEAHPHTLNESPYTVNYVAVSDTEANATYNAVKRDFSVFQCGYHEESGGDACADQSLAGASCPDGQAAVLCPNRAPKCVSDPGTSHYRMSDESRVYTFTCNSTYYNTSSRVCVGDLPEGGKFELEYGLKGVRDSCSRYLPSKRCISACREYDMVFMDGGENGMSMCIKREECSEKGWYIDHRLADDECTNECDTGYAM